MMSQTSLSKGDQRRTKMMNLLKNQGRVSVQELIENFACSEATARRDLDILEKAGFLVRTIGGALYEGVPGNVDVSLSEKKQQLWAEKEAIAAQAAKLVEEGDIVGLTGGTTTYLIARALRMHQGITVVTNAVNTAVALAENEGIQVVVTGGVMRNKGFELCGPLAEKTLQDINISKMFIGVDGVTKEHGLTTHSEQEAHIARLMIRRSTHTIAVFDHTKAGRASLFHIAPLSGINACITDAIIDPATVADYQKANVAVYVAKEL